MKKTKSMGPKVQNGAVIRRLAKRSVLANPKKSSIVIASIALCTFLFTALFIVGGSIITKFNESNARQSGGTADAAFKYLNEEEYNRLAADEKLKGVYERIYVGDATNDELRKLRTEVWYNDDMAAEKGFSTPEVGHLPEAEDEIAVSHLFLQAFGYDIDTPDTYEQYLGTKLNLEIGANGEKDNYTFTVCGIYTGDRISTAQIALISKAFQETYAPTPKESYYDLESPGVIPGYIDADVDYYLSLGLRYQMVKTIQRDQLPENVSVGINWAFGANTMDYTTILMVFMMLLTIFFSGYLIINNVYRINVYTDIRTYGLLKTVGCSGKQLKRVVKWQSVYHSIPGILIGMLCGTGVGTILLPFVMKNLVFSGTTDTHVELKWWVFVLSALISYLTVYVSVGKATKIASKVSPIEALRFSEHVDHKKKAKKRANGFTPMRFALRNVFREPKRCFFVVLSLALSIVILNSVYTLIHGFDEDKYIEQFIANDFSVADALTDNPAIFDQSYDGITDTFLEELQKQKGVLQVGNVYAEDGVPQYLNDRDWARFKERFLDNPDVYSDFRYGMGMSDGSGETLSLDEMKVTIAKIYGMDPYAIDTLEIHGDFDAEKFATGKYVLVSENDMSMNPTAYCQPGETVTVENMDGEKRDYEVMATVLLPFAIRIQSFQDLDVSYILPPKEFLDFCGERTAMRCLVDVDPAYEDAIEAWMANYTTTEEPALTYTSRGTYKQEFNEFVQLFRVVGGLLSAVLAMIGILNFVNIMVTSILARRLELAMLEAVGMTKKVQLRSICLEGLVYALMSVVAGVILSTVASFTLVKAYGSEMWYFTHHFTLVPILWVAPAMLLAAVVIAVAIYRNTMNSSVIERLRLAEA
ncbi:MAG: ABC transporter permease [Lachnospiraceae bacterium]|nr:ABC transporter permease [Lachnospiraceae bacterium]